MANDNLLPNDVPSSAFESIFNAKPKNGDVPRLMMKSQLRTTTCIHTFVKYSTVIDRKEVDECHWVLEGLDREIENLLQNSSSIRRITYYEICYVTHTNDEQRSI